MDRFICRPEKSGVSIFLLLWRCSSAHVHISTFTFNEETKHGPWRLRKKPQQETGKSSGVTRGASIPVWLTLQHLWSGMCYSYCTEKTDGAPFVALKLLMALLTLPTVLPGFWFIIIMRFCTLEVQYRVCICNLSGGMGEWALPYHRVFNTYEAACVSCCTEKTNPLPCT